MVILSLIKVIGIIDAVVRSLSHVWPFVTPRTAAWHTSLSFTISWNFLKFMSTELVMLSNHLTFCHPLLLLLSIFPSIRVFSHELALCIRWPKSWSLVSPSNEYLGLISLGLPLWLSCKEPACNVGDLGLIPGLERSPGEGKGYPLQYSGLENSMDCIVHGGRKKSDMIEWLSLTPLGLTGLIYLLSKGLSRVFSSAKIQKHQFFGAQPSLWSNSQILTWLLEKS